MNITFKYGASSHDSHEECHNRYFCARNRRINSFLGFVFSRPFPIIARIRKIGKQYSSGGRDGYRRHHFFIGQRMTVLVPVLIIDPTILQGLVQSWKL